MKLVTLIFLLNSLFTDHGEFFYPPSVRLCAPLCSFETLVTVSRLADSRPLVTAAGAQEEKNKSQWPPIGTSGPAQRRIEGVGDCSRIVSLAPSITEVLIGLGLGKNLVGVTRFDRLPDDLSGLARIGGYMDLNIEQVRILKPSVVIGFSEHVDSLSDFKRLGLSVMQVEHRNLVGIAASIEELGDYCGKAEQASSLVETIGQLEQELLAKINQEDSDSPRVLVLLGYPGGELFASGTDGFYSAIIDRLGAQNALGATTMSLGALSPESVIHLNPDVIFHISGANEQPLDQSVLISYWSRFSSISAVKSQRIYTFHGYDFTIPGPNYPFIMQQFARALYGIS